MMLRAGTAALVLAGGLYVGATKIGPLPALGRFLDPAHGIWSVARAAELPSEFTGAIAGLGLDVRVVYDRRGVPHIWASTVEDATRALGFVVARDRLFQLDIQTRATAGRLSEWAGERVLGIDRQQRLLGLAASAERDVAALDSASRDFRFLRAYADGVNAWIDAMRVQDLPFEYHLLGVEPETWKPVNSVYLLKRMGYTLTYNMHDRTRLKIIALVGREAADALFPVEHPIQEPIQPNGQTVPRFDFNPPPPPGKLDPHALTLASRLDGLPSPTTDGGDAVGSNNWAVAPERTANGNAILAGDPHLELTLPSIWYEVHIVVPGELDVYGVTIPGALGVVIGFTRDVAWSFTNTEADVLDLYGETFDDTKDPARYRVDNEWRDLERRIEEYRGRNGDIVAVDTFYATHRGPVIQVEPVPISMRWTLLDEPAVQTIFFDAARATSSDAWLAAMEAYTVPAQNMLVADRQGNISVRSNGHFPIRSGNGDGRAIRDGSTSQTEWQGYWQVSEYPQAHNPRQGYLASANQQPIDPHVNDRYLRANWFAPWRALQINRLLRADSLATPDAMRRYQTDPGNAKADLFVPAFLDVAARVLAREPDRELEEAAVLLGNWDRRFTKSNERAVLFELAMRELTDRTWDELTEPQSDSRVATPREPILALLLEYRNSPWWDDRSTHEVVETRDHIVAASLKAALAAAKKRYGPPADGGWRWDRVRHANVFHYLRLPALSMIGLPIQGGSGTLNPASGGVWGASWRMIVELGPRVRAWTTYPGGQSGNPASSWYTDRIQQWIDGELEEVLFPETEGDFPIGSITGTLTLSPKQP